MATDNMITLPDRGDHVDHVDQIDVEDDKDGLLEIAVTYAGKTFTVHLPPQATVGDVALLCESELQSRASSSFVTKGEDDDDGDRGAPLEYTVTKFIAPPPIGLVHVAKDAETTLGELAARLNTGSSSSSGRDKAKRTAPPPLLKLRLMASPTSAVDALRKTSDAMKQRATRLADLRRRAVPARTTTPRGGSGGARDPTNTTFVFADIRPLPHLPHPERALAYLHRLRDDAGIRHVMKTHQFRVGLLTEMDPLLYTESSHEGTSRTLGLNRNHGEVIELRLRTDAGDGYRDYKTVRRTLCHELAHNVHGPHDQHFWALYRQLEGEVERVGESLSSSSRGSGRSLAGGREGDFYEPPAGRSDADDHEQQHVDSGGWTGGTYVLGSGEAKATATMTAGSVVATTASPTAAAGVSNTPTAQRERRARAAEERLQQRGGGGAGSGGNSTSGEAHPSSGGSGSPADQ